MLRSALTKIACSTPLVTIANATVKELYGYYQPEFDDASTLTNVVLKVYETTGELMIVSDREFALGLLQDRFNTFVSKLG